MYKMRSLLLMLLTCFYTGVSFAQISVNIEIQGLNDELKNNVLLLLSIEQQKDHPLLSEDRIYQLHRKAPQEIANALKPYGYYRPEVKSQLTRSAQNQWQATYSINPGKPLLIRSFNFTLSGESESDPEFQNLSTNLPLHENDVLNHVLYEKIKSDLSKLAAERGYFNAHFVEHRIEINLDSYEAQIFLHYDSGPRYHFGDINVQQDLLDPGLLQRFLDYEKGAPYSLIKVLDIQQALNDSDYFRNVEVSPGQPDTSNNEIPVNVVLTPRKQNRYILGLGYGTDTGARTKFGWEVPRVNRDGHRFNSEVRVSEIGYNLLARYRVPVLNPRSDQIVYSAGVVREKTDSSESTVRTIGIGLNRSRGPWRESANLNYQKEEYQVAEEKGTSTLLIPGINWSRTWGSDFIFTFDGLRFDIGLRGASDKLISDSSFAQLQGAIKAISPLGKQSRLITRGSFGRSWTDEFHQLPSSVRFFAGGSQSVRGYAYQSLGPEDNNGKVIGGKHLLTGSIELERTLVGKWGVALFYDVGNAIDNLDDDLERGAGFGLRWRSPIGPVRIDFASAVSRENQPWRIHINIGPDL